MLDKNLCQMGTDHLQTLMTGWLPTATIYQPICSTCKLPNGVKEFLHAKYSFKIKQCENSCKFLLSSRPSQKRVPGNCFYCPMLYLNYSNHGSTDNFSKEMRNKITQSCSMDSKTNSSEPFHYSISWLELPAHVHIWFSVQTECHCQMQ